MKKTQNCRELIQEIKNFHKETGIQYYKIAELSGLHRNTLRAIEDKDFNPRIDTVDKVIKFMNKF